LRSMSLPLRENGKTLGFLQIQVPTEQRDLSIEKFIFTNLILCPIFLFSLALAGYMVSGKAVRPVQESYQILKMFVQDAGHELKTPVAAIQITAENLAEDLQDAEMQERLGVITRNTERMTKLVTDMLTLAKMEVTSSTVRLEKVDVRQLLEQLREEFVPRFAQANKKFDTNLQVVPKVMGEADSLSRLFSNLIENALKYTEEGNSVTVNLKAKDNKIEVAIIDTGIGIPKDSIPHLFDRFYRVDRSRARVRGGSGLGLSIVKAITELHGGTLNVVSAEGRGSTFTVSIPTV
ncbi:MAG: GHKL domain-containing protein, partial [Leptolyngbya sp.]|nr:GHKL domain-containing protein [Candidatus Melainabacteria bacterium]